MITDESFAEIGEHAVLKALIGGDSEAGGYEVVQHSLKQ